MDQNSLPDDVTALLSAAGSGDATAADRLFSVVYDELRRLAAAYIRQERPDHTLQPTALVHEAYLRLVGPAQGGAGFENRGHFLATAALAMRRILINHAAAKKAEKRGGDRPVLRLDETVAAFEDRAIDLLALDDALNRLAVQDPLQARLVELRFFGGMPFEQCAEILGVSPRLIYYEWAHARAWLKSQLASG
jgi:RNA polymerase sigma factor (TIGR02999 family)